MMNILKYSEKQEEEKDSSQKINSKNTENFYWR